MSLEAHDDPSNLILFSALIIRWNCSIRVLAQPGTPGGPYIRGPIQTHGETLILASSFFNPKLSVESPLGVKHVLIPDLNIQIKEVNFQYINILIWQHMTRSGHIEWTLGEWREGTLWS